MELSEENFRGFGMNYSCSDQVVCANDCTWMSDGPRKHGSFTMQESSMANSGCPPMNPLPWYQTDVESKYDIPRYMGTWRNSWSPSKTTKTIPPCQTSDHHQIFFFRPTFRWIPNSVRSLADGLSIWNSRCTEDHISKRLRGSELQGCCQGLKVQTQQPAKAGRFVIREELWEDGRWFVCFFGGGFDIYIYILCIYTYVQWNKYIYMHTYVCNVGCIIINTPPPKFYFFKKKIGGSTFL